jgi:hypothetical protein
MISRQLGTQGLQTVIGYNGIFLKLSGNIYVSTCAASHCIVFKYSQRYVGHVLNLFAKLTEANAQWFYVSSLK